MPKIKPKKLVEHSSTTIFGFRYFFVVCFGYRTPPIQEVSCLGEFRLDLPVFEISLFDPPSPTDVAYPAQAIPPQAWRPIFPPIQALAVTTPRECTPNEIIHNLFVDKTLFLIIRSILTPKCFFLAPVHFAAGNKIVQVVPKIYRYEKHVTKDRNLPGKVSESEDSCRVVPN